MSPYYHGYIYSPEWKPTLFSGSTELSENPEGKYYFASGYLPEGSQVFVQLLTQGVSPGTWLYWRGEGAGIDDNDFTNNHNWGGAPIKQRVSSDGWDGEITFTHTFKNDSTTEENLEYLRYYIYADHHFSSPLGNTDNQIAIQDTSKSAPTTNAKVISWKQGNPHVLEEGYKSFPIQRLIEIEASGVSLDGRAGKWLDYEFVGDGVTADDFRFASHFPGDEANKGSAYIDKYGKISIYHTLKADNKTEGNEKVYVQLYDNGVKVSGPLPYFEIKDTSVAPEYIIEAPSVFKEGETLDLLVKYRGMPDPLGEDWSVTTSFQKITWKLEGDGFGIGDVIDPHSPAIQEIFGTRDLIDEFSGAFRTSGYEGDSEYKSVSLRWGLIPDLVPEGKEKATFSLYRSGQEVASHSFSVADKSSYATGEVKYTYSNRKANIDSPYYSPEKSREDWSFIQYSKTTEAKAIIDAFFEDSQPVNSISEDLFDSKYYLHGGDQVLINRVAQASIEGASMLQGKQLNRDTWSVPTGSVLNGGEGNDVLRGLAGWDVIDGRGGDDLIHGGNGRDIIDGGLGADELHGDFGFNTYRDQRDGYKDHIVIKSDQKLVNWWYGKAGNNSSGQKADIIEGLDADDKITIIATFNELKVQEGANFWSGGRMRRGLGIYIDGYLEAIYAGFNNKN